MEDGHVGPYPPPKGDKTHAHASEQAHIHAKLLFFFFLYSVPSRLHDKFAPSL